MPLYEYQCEVCGHRFEVIQKFSDAPVETCPKCSGAVRKLLSTPAIQFKGSGWYITDYARAGKSEGQTDGSKPATEGAATGGSGETRSEGKAETKTESSATSSSSSSSGPGSPDTP